MAWRKNQRLPEPLTVDHIVAPHEMSPVEIDLTTRRDAALRIIHRLMLAQSLLLSDDRNMELFDALVDLKGVLLPPLPVRPGRSS